MFAPLSRKYRDTSGTIARAMAGGAGQIAGVVRRFGKGTQYMV